MEIYEREATAQERAILERRAGDARGWGEAVFTFVVLFLILLGAIVAIKAMLGVRGHLERPVILTAAAVALAAAGVRWRRVRAEGVLAAQDYEAGRVRVERFHVCAAIQVGEAGKVDSGFFLKLIDGRVVFLSGLYLWELCERGQFPCTQFEVVRGVHSKRVVELKCLGEYFPAVVKRRGFTREERTGGAVPEDGAVFAADFEGLKEAGQ